MSNLKSEETENEVREYFEARAGWTVKKLDLGKKSAPDFQISNERTISFFCEVKTIESVRADLPYTPIEYFREQRRKRQDEIQKWKNQNPGAQLILRPGEWEFVYGDEIEFEKKYRQRSRNTETSFQNFRSKLTKDLLRNSTIRDLSYSLRVDSDDLYVPNSKEYDNFVKWLESEIQAIDQGRISWQWHNQKLPFSSSHLYSSFYTLHEANNENDIKHELQITLEGPTTSGPLGVDIFSYGGLNLDSITSNVDKGIKQLQNVANRNNLQYLPRLIVLAFESGLGFDREQLSEHIQWLLTNHPDLSAIAVLDRVPDGTPTKEEQDDLFKWFEFQRRAPWVIRFMVYHNQNLIDVASLPKEAFNDKWSVDINPTNSL